MAKNGMKNKEETTMKLDMNKYDALTKQDIIDILDTLKTANVIDIILTKANELALEKYDLGFDDGYYAGNKYPPHC